MDQLLTPHIKIVNDYLLKSSLNGKVYIFTDGSSRNNGKENCTANYGYFIIDGVDFQLGCGPVNEVKIDKQVYSASNNRGELTAILNAITTITDSPQRYKDIVIVSDSDYCIQSVTNWGLKWRRNNDKTKKNLDLIYPIMDLISNNKQVNIKFMHVNSHLKEPGIKDDNWFYWKGNDIADKLCS